MLRHIDLLNVALALQFAQPDYPDCLTRLGYLVHLVGVRMTLADGAKVHPDVVATSGRASLTLLIEVKGGKDIDGDQLARMLRVGPAELRHFAHLPIEDVAKHRAHVVCVCNEARREDFAAALGERCATIVGFDGARFRLSGTPLPDPSLADCLTEAIIDPAARPLAIVPFDAESSDAEIGACVIPEVVRTLVEGGGTITADAIVSRTHHVIRPAMQQTGSGSDLTAISARVKRVLEGLAAGELAEWLVHPPGQPVYRLRRALPGDSAGRTRELQRIARAGRRYLEASTGGEPAQLLLTYDDATDGLTPTKA